MSVSSTHYSVLGVHPSASLAEIKAAYKAAALRHHPDKQIDCAVDSGEFSTVQRAWEVLREAGLREKYDHQLSLQQTVANTPISEDIELEDMEEVEHEGERWYSYPCRCSGGYDVPAAEVTDSLLNCMIVGCSGCSLYVSINLPSRQ